MLGLHAGCTDSEIREAYIAKARTLHPDAGGDTAAFTELVVAYCKVNTPPERMRYDRMVDITCDPCPACNGAGCKRRQKSFHSVQVTICSVCDGAGYKERP